MKDNAQGSFHPNPTEKKKRIHHFLFVHNAGKKLETREVKGINVGAGSLTRIMHSVLSVMKCGM